MYGRVHQRHARPIVVAGSRSRRLLRLLLRDGVFGLEVVCVLQAMQGRQPDQGFAADGCAFRGWDMQ